MLNEMTKRNTSNIQKVVTPVSKSLTDSGTNTEPSIFNDHQISIGNKVTAEVETQTVELPTIEFGSEELLDVPLMFYNSLMSDSNLQNKLASAINEHLTDHSSSSKF